MKTGFCVEDKWLFEKRELLKVLDETGCDGIELWPHAFEPDGIDPVKKAIDAHKFGVAALNPYMDFATSEETWQKAVKTAEEFFNYAQILNCKRVRTHTCLKDRSFKNSDDAKPIHWQRAIKGLQTVADIASNRGILCVLEVAGADGQLYDTSKATLRILEGVDRKNVVVNLQPPLRGEDPLESARLLGPYVQHLHIHNWVGQWGNFTYLDRGDVNIPLFLNILREKGFDGYMSIEHSYESKLSSDGKRDPVEVAKHEIPYLKKLIAERY